MERELLLYCHNLYKSYTTGSVVTPILRGISLSLYVGELVALVGRSGSGKSTLLHLLSGLESPCQGEIFFRQQPLHQLSARAKACFRNQSLGFIYQFHHLLPDFTALENVAIPLLIAGVAAVTARQRATELLLAMSLEKRMHHRPAALSGGERQRVAVARALVNQPALVLADEPTGDLDQENSRRIFDVITLLNRQQGTTFFIATHDLTLANCCHRQWYIEDGVLFSTPHTA